MEVTLILILSFKEITFVSTAVARLRVMKAAMVKGVKTIKLKQVVSRKCGIEVTCSGKHIRTEFHKDRLPGTKIEMSGIHTRYYGDI